MKSVGRIVPQTNAHYVELLKKLVKLITENKTIQSQVVKTLYRKISKHCASKKSRSESIYPFIAPLKEALAIVCNVIVSTYSEQNVYGSARDANAELLHYW